MTESDPPRPADPQDDGDAGYSRDPAATPDEAGVPEVADDRSPGTGEVPEPERASMPTDAPVEVFAHGTTALEQAEGASLEDRLAAEEPEAGEPGRESSGESGSMHVEEPRQDQGPQ